MHPLATGTALQPEERFTRASKIMGIYKDFVKAHDKSPLGA